MKRDAVAGRYRVEKLLGAGSSGFVVVARHVYLGHEVTLKILASMSNAQQRAQRRSLSAAHAAASLRGPHVARIVDTGFTEEGMPFIATEYLEGRTLLDEMKERGPLPIEEAVRWVLQACEALAEAHASGVVHGDLKPQNIFLAVDVDREGSDHDQPRIARSRHHEERSLKILDFGMASGVADDDGDEGTFATWFASPAYLAPEQLQDSEYLDPRVDVWALGVIVHELIAGALPFDADSVSGMLVAVMNHAPRPLVEAPNELAQVVRACLSKDPSERPADIRALARALAPFAGTEGPALVARVAEAASTAVKPLPSSDPTVSSGEDPFGVSQREGETTRTSMIPFIVERRRRRNTIAKLAGAAVLTAVAIAASPSSGGSTTEAGDPPRVPAEEVPPRPFVPRSFDLGHRAAGPRDVATPAAVSPARPKTPQEIGPRAQRPQTPQPAAKPRATLSVRENPYGTHGQRPPPHRNRPR